MDARFHTVSKETDHFLKTFDTLSFSEKLTFLAVLFEQMENGQINSDNSADPAEVEYKDGSVFYPADAGLPNGAGIGNNILAQKRNMKAG